MAKKHHYVYGSGQPGCLYDNGPHTSSTLRGALESLSFMFDCLPQRALQRMRGDLRRFGVHYFPDTPCRDYDAGCMTTVRSLAGAGMASITRYEGPCPKDSES